MVLTNGTRISETGPLRKFRLISTHEDSSWVKALNGNYAGELLTFLTTDLRPIQ
jgi:hypothetical protein